MNQPPPGTGRARGRARGRQRQPPELRTPGDKPSPRRDAVNTTTGYKPSPVKPSPRRDAVDTTAALVQDMSKEKTAAAALVQDMSTLSVDDAGGKQERRTRNVENTRPVHLESKRGGVGKPLKLLTNYYTMNSKTEWSLKQHRVDFNPGVDGTGVRKKLLRQHYVRLGKHYIFDGTMLFCEERLDLELLSVKESDGTKVRIIIKFTQEVPPSDHQFINIFNIITNQCMSLVGFVKLRKQDREYFNMQSAMSADHGRLEIWPGFGAAVNQFEHKVMMCVNVSHKVLRMDNVLDQLSAIQQHHPRDVHGMAERQLLGAVVMCRHNLRTYKIDEIMWNKTPKDEFEYKGKMIPLFQYYLEKHNLKVHLNQPLLLSNPKRREMRQGIVQPFWLVPELCNMTGLSNDMRNNYGLMKELSAYLNMAPDKRKAKLEQFGAKMQAEDVQELLAFWGIEFSKKLLQIEANVLPAEKIQTNRETLARNGSWNDAVKTGVMSHVPLERWFVFYTRRTCTEAQLCVGGVIKVARNFGMRINEPTQVMVADDKVSTYVQAIDQSIDPAQVQLVMCIIPTKDKTKYDAIKQLLCLRKPVPSQVVTAKLIQSQQNKNFLGVATKIALQINCKLGGVPWEVKIPMKFTMIVGYDTYHESQHKGASAGAWVASMNPNASKYYSHAVIHTGQEEISSFFQRMTTLSMIRYKEYNGQYPDNVIVFRDGIGEGSVRYVRLLEVERIKAAFSALGVPTKLCFIIVTKNINTRLLLQTGNGPPANPPPGTVVDDVITRPERYDFYLVSQVTKLGTVTPTMYNVIEDQTDYKPKHLQMLAYKLAHLYYNITSTCRVPAPTHYAHRLAFLVGQSVHNAFNVSLQDTLFYL